MNVMKECSDSWFSRKKRISSLPERDDPRCRWRVGSRTRPLENEECSLGEQEKKGRGGYLEVVLYPFNLDIVFSNVY